MTDLIPDPDDELASAYLDDEVTAEERARVEADPALQARVAAMRRARELVESTIDYPPSTARDDAIRIALARAPVVDLRVERAGRRVRIASIAAAVLVVIGVAGFLVRLATESSTEKKFSTAAGALSTTTAASGAAGQAATAADNAFAANGLASLGSFTDRAALVDATRAALTPASTAKAATPEGSSAGGERLASACTVPPPAGATSSVLTTSAVLDGAAVRVDVFSMNDGPRRLVVSDAQTCVEVFSQAL